MGATDCSMDRTAAFTWGGVGDVEGADIHGHTLPAQGIRRINQRGRRTAVQNDPGAGVP